MVWYRTKPSKFSTLENRNSESNGKFNGFATAVATAFAMAVATAIVSGIYRLKKMQAYEKQAIFEEILKLAGGFLQ